MEGNTVSEEFFFLKTKDMTNLYVNRTSSLEKKTSRNERDC